MVFPIVDATASRQVPCEVSEALAVMRRPIMISHVVPDADALGAMLSMALAWSSDACAPKVSLPPTSLSGRLSFLVERASADVASAEDFAVADGFVALDTAGKGRCNVGPALKDTDWSAGRTLVNIDHHATNTRFGDVNWVIDHASSTCEMIYHLLQSAEKRMDPPIPSLLYAGIQTDTLGFTLPITSASSLAACTDLVACGAEVGEIGERLYRSQSISAFDLMRVIYANTKVLAGGRVAYSSANYDEIRRAGCTAADIDDQITVPRSLEGVVLAMLFSEGNQGRTRINFRGSGPVTVVELAEQFGGGGHSQAAGAILDCVLDQAIEQVVPQAISHVETFTFR